jgi:hypothetical protein
MALDLLEWVEHHPSGMWIIAVLHFVVAWTAIAAAVSLWRWLKSS